MNKKASTNAVNPNSILVHDSDSNLTAVVIESVEAVSKPVTLLLKLRSTIVMAIKEDSAEIGSTVVIKIEKSLIDSVNTIPSSTKA